MTDNEKLIEEAAKAIFAEEQCDRHQKRDTESVTENWETRLADADQDEYRSFARAALAVFEKAHTPTDTRECGFMGCGSPRCEEVCTPEPQGEPSDALNLDYLEAVANAATPGPWTDFDDDGEAYSRPPATGAFLVEYGADAEQKMRDIRYIASVDPQTILALIALVRTAVTEQGENR